MVGAILMSAALLEITRLFVRSLPALGRRPRTIEFYEYVLTALIKFLGSRPIQSITTLDLRVHLGDLRDRRHVTLATLSCHIRAIRRFFRWALQEGYVSANPASALQLPRLPKLYPYVLTLDQVRQLLAACTIVTFEGRRLRIFILLIVGTGLRLSEVLGLRREDLDLHLGHVLVRDGKGGRPRVVPLDSVLVLALTDYLQQRRVDSPWLFCAKDGRQLTRRRAHRALRQLGKRAGLTGVRVSPHTLRHTFATVFLEQGGNLESLRQFLGHSTLAITSAYLHLSVGASRQIMERCSPLRALAPLRQQRQGR